MKEQLTSPRSGATKTVETAVDLTVLTELVERAWQENHRPA